MSASALDGCPITTSIKSRAATLFSRTPFALWPVTVRRGVAAGARWTLFPWTSYWRGTYEPAIQAELIALGDGDITGWSCWDIGAHFGLYSVGLARRIGPTGEVAAFEPNPRSFSRLERHRRANRLTWLKTFPAAASSHNAGAELYTYGDLGTTTTHLPYLGEPRTSTVGAVSVPTFALDSLVASGEIRAPQFVKIDAEGHALDVLCGMKAALAATRPIVVIGLHNPSECAAVVDLLLPLGYRWREIGSARQPDRLQVGADYLLSPTGAASASA